METFSLINYNCLCSSQDTHAFRHIARSCRKSRLPDTYLCTHQPPNLLWGCHPYFDLFFNARQRRPGKVMFSVMSASQSFCLFTGGPHVTTTNNAMGQWQITWNPLPPIQSYSKLFTWDLQGLASHMETSSALALEDYVHYVTHIYLLTSWYLVFDRRAFLF